MDLGASATHEPMKLEAVEEAATVYARAAAEAARARAARDRAVRAAVLAGVPSAQVAQAAGVSPGRVSHLTCAPKSH